MKTLIKGGTIVLEHRVMTGDLFIEDEKITRVIDYADQPAEDTACTDKEFADRVIDAAGKIVLPGGIDAHTHFNLHVAVVTSDDFTTGTTAAAFGGNTMIIDHMGFGPKGCNLHHQANVYHGYADGKCLVDYGFHGVVQQVDDEVIEEMGAMVEDGHPSFKIYLTYDYKAEDKDALRVLERLGTLGGMTTVHCENDAIIDYLKKKFVSEGKLTPHYHALSRPEICENEAVMRMIALAHTAQNAPLYIVHVSSAQSASMIKQARQNGDRVYGETCPQYLFLDESCYDLPDGEGLKYIMSPPLRSRKNQELLWDYIKDGTLKVIATDHCTFNFHGDKQRGKTDFTQCPNGGPGVETRIPLVFSAGVSEGRITLNEFANVISTNPAKLFGVYPEKGVIRCGSDADILIMDPDREVTITKDILHENVDYTPYEGFKVKGWPIMTMVRGHVVVENGELKQDPGFGRFIKRHQADYDC
ncbi:MAG: dihydropyrimidinase [Catenibacillus sp.]